MRLLLRLLLAVVFLIALAIGAVFLLPGERLAAIATDQISAATGREVELSGDVRPSLYPQLGVTTGPVRVAGAEWAEDPNLMRADSLAVGVDLMALLTGTIAVQKAEFVGPVVTLHRAADGRVNWSTGEGAEPASGDGAGGAMSPSDLSFEAIRVSDAQVVWRDDQAGQRFALSQADITLTPAGAGLSMDLAGQLNGQPLRLDAKVADLEAALAGAKVGLQLTAALAGAEVSFAGEVSPEGQAAGRVLLATSDLGAPMQALGLAPVALPAEFAGRIAVSGDLDANANRVALAGGSYEIGPFSATGPLAVDLGDRVRISGDLATGRLDLSPFTGGGGGSDGGGSGSSGWSQDVIDVSGLGAVDADIGLSASAIDLGATVLGATQAKVTLDTGRLVAALSQTQVFGAPVTGEVVVNSRGGLSMRANLKGQGLDMRQALSEFAGFDRLSGAGGLEVSLLTSGASMAQMMSRVDGTVALSVSNGELSGIDLEALLQGQPANGGTTIIEGLNAPLTVTDGVMVSDNVTLRTPVVSTRTRGQINLGAQTLDLTTRRTRDDAERGVPVRVEGPWSGPRIYPDLEAVAQEKLEEEKARVEAKIAEEKARAEARLAEEKARLEQEAKDKVAEELGVEVQEGQTLEDAAKQKLEEELKRGLGNLLGGN